MDKKQICDLLKNYKFAKLFCKKAEEKYGTGMKPPDDQLELIDYQMTQRQYKNFKKKVEQADQILDFIRRECGEVMESCVIAHYVNGETTSHIVKGLNISKRKLDYDLQDCLQKTMEYLNDDSKKQN